MCAQFLLLGKGRVHGSVPVTLEGDDQSCGPSEAAYYVLASPLNVELWNGDRDTPILV